MSDISFMMAFILGILVGIVFMIIIHLCSEKPLNAGDFVVVPTRYGKDMARVLGIAKKPIGIKQSDIATIDRKANEADLKRREELIQKEKDAFPIFKEKVALHKLDMKLVETHFLFDEQKALFFF